MKWIRHSKLTAVNITIARAQHLGSLTEPHASLISISGSERWIKWNSRRKGVKNRATEVALKTFQICFLSKTEKRLLRAQSPYWT